MTSVQSGVKEAVERVTAGLAKADDLGVERTLFGRSGPGLVMSDLRTLLATLSSQAEVMEAMPDLTAVIAWLQNGCDPVHAITELAIYQGRIDRARQALNTGDQS